MKPTENPNIFDYATSELSQDAFICYMLNFPPAAKLFLKKCKIENENILNIERQHMHIDILVETDNHYLIIEDKTGTGEHDDQIVRYVNILTEQQKKGKLNPKKNINVCYLKTHDFLWDYQPSENNDAGLKEKENCVSLNRDAILDILKNVPRDTIFEQFKSYLEAFDVDTSVPISNWNRKHWFKFLAPIIKEKKDKEPKLWADIGYVPNRSGGFYACWFGGDEKSFPNYTLYKQIEIECSDKETYNIKLCYKVATNNVQNGKERPKIDKGTLDDIRKNFKQPEGLEFKITGRSGGWSTTYAKKEFSEQFADSDIKKAIETFIKSDSF